MVSEIRQEPEMVRNARWTSGVIRQAGKIIFYVLMMGILSLLIAPVLMIDITILRILANVVVFAGVWMLLYGDGGTRGQKEVAYSQTLARRESAGGKITPEDISRCYHPKRGVLTAALGALPFLLLAVALAFLAKPVTYTLQDLPTWLKAYLRREDIGGALKYYDHLQGPGVVDYLRIVVRLTIMPLSYIAGSFGDEASLLLDRLSPLLTLILPSAYAIGYSRGHALNRMVIKRNEEAKRLHKKRVARKKKRERQAAGNKGPERLI